MIFFMLKMFWFLFLKCSVRISITSTSLLLIDVTFHVTTSEIFAPVFCCANWTARWLILFDKQAAFVRVRRMRNFVNTGYTRLNVKR